MLRCIIFFTSFICNVSLLVIIFLKFFFFLIDCEEIKALALTNAEKAFKAHVSQVSCIIFHNSSDCPIAVIIVTMARGEWLSKNNYMQWIALLV